MNEPAPRVTLGGKFFRLGKEKFYLRGVTYGPFAPNQAGEMFPEPAQAKADLALLAKLSANVLRLYYVPPRWFLDLAEAQGLKLFIDIPWEKHRCFLDTYEGRQEAKQTVRKSVSACAGHPAVFAFSIVNEIPAEIVRWSGVGRVERFIDDLIIEARDIDSAALYTFSSFPPTEFLNPSEPDFVCFNVYLHHQSTFEDYLLRLQSIAGPKPMVLGECGADSLSLGEREKCEMLAWQIETTFRSGAAGMFIFSFTDDWFRGGQQIENWGFGLTDRFRNPKPSFDVVRDRYSSAPNLEKLPRPKVSVVVASYNGGATLAPCLDSLMALRYPDYEVILVDDGSTDNTPEIAARYPQVRTIRQPNLGLSAARNTGINAARGEVVAFTDSDCRADEDWLGYLVLELGRNGLGGVGGHNFLPPDDSPVAAAVMASPGGPAQVMLTDRDAEHIPGCNMAFYKSVLDQLGGFDRQFRKAGDDVDLCWRLLEAGYRIGFSHGGFVWHYRRSTVKAYLHQQRGYGEAEALLQRKHPEYFNSLGGSVWHGRIYGAAFPGLFLRPPVIYHGLFGSAFFQKIYAPEPAIGLAIFTSLEYHLLVHLPLLLLTPWLDFALPVLLSSLGLTGIICALTALQIPLAREKTHWWSRPLIAFLNFLQPIYRGAARYRTSLDLQVRAKPISPDDAVPEGPTPRRLFYWTKKSLDRYQWLEAINKRLEDLHWPATTDTGWSKYDLQIRGNRWTTINLITVSEELAEGRKFFRCGFAPIPSWISFLTAVGTLLLVLLGIAFFRHETPFIWFLLPLLPLTWFFLWTKTDLICRAIATVVHQSAGELGLNTYDPADGNFGTAETRAP